MLAIEDTLFEGPTELTAVFIRRKPPRGGRTPQAARWGNIWARGELIALIGPGMAGPLVPITKRF